MKSKKISEWPGEKIRCQWCKNDEKLINYHDNEWGTPTSNDFKLFETLCLESFQSGLNWRTILNKRENFRDALVQFDFNKIASFDAKAIDHLLKNQGIVRHRGKIQAVVANAKVAQALVKEFHSLGKFIWSFEFNSVTQSPLNVARTFSNEIKNRGGKFIGPTTAKSFFQAIGLINGHSMQCFRREEVLGELENFDRP